jgi:hypothetical protein
MGRTARTALLTVLGALVLAAVACAAPAQPATLLDVTTRQTICGGTIPPPGQPFCRTSPSSRNITVSSGRTVVASGRTGTDGRLVVAVPAGPLNVRVPDAQPYETCDSPAAAAVAGQTVGVTQTCTIYAP